MSCSATDVSSGFSAMTLEECSLTKKSILPLHRYILDFVFDNRMEAMTPCMTLLDAAAKRN